MKKKKALIVFGAVLVALIAGHLIPVKTVSGTYYSYKPQSQLCEGGILYPESTNFRIITGGFRGFLKSQTELGPIECTPQVILKLYLF